jgi:beta-glucosidase-like glycosyl hydrolase
MTKPFSIALKRQLVARLTGVNAVSAAQLSRETGIGQQNLSRWLSESRDSPHSSLVSGNDVACWSAEQKARVIVQAAHLAGDELTRYLESEGVKLVHFNRWRRALVDAGEVSVGVAKRIRGLERELARKDRALAEAAVRLVLRESVEKLIRSAEEEAEDRIEAAELNYSV